MGSGCPSRRCDSSFGPRSDRLALTLLALRHAASARCGAPPSGLSTTGPVAVSITDSAAVPLLRFSFDSRDFRLALGRSRRSAQTIRGSRCVLERAFSTCLPQASRAPFRVHPERGPRPPGDAASGVQPVVARGLPIPRYSARCRPAARRSGARRRWLAGDWANAGFAPASRLASRVPLRSCFRPGTRVGFPVGRLAPPLASRRAAFLAYARRRSRGWLGCSRRIRGPCLELADVATACCRIRRRSDDPKA